MEENTATNNTPETDALAVIGTVQFEVKEMFKDIEAHEASVLNVLNRLHGISYPYPYAQIDRDFYDAYKALRDLQLKLREAAAAISK